MYSQLDLELFKIFWRKELSFGCIIKMPSIFEYRRIVRWEMKWTFQVEYSWDIDVREGEYEILWHEPTITDVFRVADEKWYYGIELEHIIDKDYYLWCNEVRIKSYNPTLPLLQQTDETKQQLIDLFQSQ